MGKYYLFAVFVVIQLTITFSDAALQIDNESELREGQASIFNDNATTGWLLLNYVGDSTVHFAAGGTGTASDVVGQLDDDQIQYILIREPIDENYRDVFIAWIGPGVDAAEKRRKTAYLGDAEQLLQPFHSSLTALKTDNFNDDTIIDRSHPLSGSHVID